MQKHINQARHNQEFHNSINTNFQDKFFDWKITVLFYVAIHYLKALSAKEGIKIGDTHYEIEQNVNPDRNNAKMRVSRGAWREYKNLFRYSQSARYDGIIDNTTFEQIKERDHAYCLKHLENFKKYIKSRNVQVK